MLGQRLACHAALAAQHTHALAELAQVSVGGGFGAGFHVLRANMHYNTQQGAMILISEKELLSLG